MKRMWLFPVVAWTAAVVGADVVNPLKRENAPVPVQAYDFKVMNFRSGE